MLLIENILLNLFTMEGNQYMMVWCRVNESNHFLVNCYTI